VAVTTATPLVAPGAGGAGTGTGTGSFVPSAVVKATAVPPTTPTLPSHRRWPGSDGQRTVSRTMPLERTRPALSTNAGARMPGIHAAPSAGGCAGRDPPHAVVA
jgi:hypothetical protein